MAAIIDITGQTFGRLKVLHKHPENDSLNRVCWVCECSCGTIVTINGWAIRSGNTKSCGCYANDLRIQLGKANRTHGMTNTPEYKTWDSMKERCNNPNSSQYLNYGGRGIRVCDSWYNSFEAFYRDMGPRPSDKHSIDRRDNDGHYDPGNCRWALMEVQANNKRNNVNYEFNGSRMSLSKIARETGIPQQTLYSRINRMGLTIEEAVSWNNYNHRARSQS